MTPERLSEIKGQITAMADELEDYKREVFENTDSVEGDALVSALEDVVITISEADSEISGIQILETDTDFIKKPS
jgi:hypothetical protein